MVTGFCINNRVAFRCSTLFRRLLSMYLKTKESLVTGQLDKSTVAWSSFDKRRQGNSLIQHYWLFMSSSIKAGQTRLQSAVHIVISSCTHCRQIENVGPILPLMLHPAQVSLETSEAHATISRDISNLYTFDPSLQKQGQALAKYSGPDSFLLPLGSFPFHTSFISGHVKLCRITNKLIEGFLRLCRWHWGGDWLHFVWEWALHNV